MKSKITKRQKELLSIVHQYIKNTGYPPTFEEMRDSLKVSSNQSVVDLLRQLEKKKFIRRDEGIARSLVILPLGYEILGKPPLVPFLGVSKAGAPLDTVDITGEWREISPELSQLSDKIFLLKISGDSMINAGIDDGDVVLVKNEKEFIPNDIVLAQTGDGPTVKRFISQDSPPYVFLKPENPNHENILFTDEVQLVGKVISVVKDGQWRSVK